MPAAVSVLASNCILIIENDNPLLPCHSSS
jgi:hypothetical protein